MCAAAALGVVNHSHLLSGQQRAGAMQATVEEQ